MPPSFTPKESATNPREPREAEPPRTAEEVADQIAKEVRARRKQKERIGNHEQPLERNDPQEQTIDKPERIGVSARESKKSCLAEAEKGKASPTAESLSEAIGTRFRGARREEASSVSAGNGGERTGRDEEAKVQGRQYSVKIYRPHIDGKPVESIQELRQVIDERYPGLKALEGYERFMKTAERHLELNGYLGNRTTLDYGEIPRIARGFQTGTAQVRKWVLDGVVPKIYQMMGEATGERVSKIEGSEISIQYGTVRGVEVRSAEQLNQMIEDQYPTLKKKNDFQERLAEANVHLKLVEKYAGGGKLGMGAISEISRKTGVDEDSIGNWMTKGLTPRLYTYLEWAVPRSEAGINVQRIRDSNNGVHNMNDLDRRFDSYYFGTNERNAHFHKRERFRAQRYFDFLETYSRGGNTLDIAKKLGISDGMAYGYLHGERPWLVNIATKIPSEQPPHDYKWLPKVVGQGIRREEWIQVPEKVTDYRQVLDVLSKLRPLDNKEMRKLALRFGKDGPRAENLMKLMGAICSDSSVPISSTSSMGFGINLSKAYSWSRNFGDSCCYYLGLIGLHAHRTSDGRSNVSHISTPTGPREIRGVAQYRWEGESSPILRWIRRSCLGYDDSPKTYQKISADWILSAPRQLRIAFLQGFADGDGSASYKGNYFSISTHSNHEFMRKLFESFELETYTSRTYVRTKGVESLLKVASLPPFKHAATRQRDLEAAVVMFDATRRNIQTNPPSAGEVRFMEDLRRRGFSFGEIRKRLYEKYGYTIDQRDISRLVQGNT